MMSFLLGNSRHKALRHAQHRRVFKGGGKVRSDQIGRLKRVPQLRQMLLASA